LHLIIESFFHHVILTSLCPRSISTSFFIQKRRSIYKKKQKEQKRKKKASAKQKKRATQKNQKCGCPNLPRLKLVRSGLSVLSDFTKPVNLSDFTRAENWSVLPDFTKAVNLSVFTRAENWSDLACLFVPLGLVRFYQG
jgi:hypothetical protein